MREALLSSENSRVEQALMRLEQAAAVYGETFQGLGGERSPQDRARLRHELRKLRKDLAVVARLAESGASVYQGLLRLLGAAAGGYTPQGDGAPLRGSMGVAVQG